MAAGDFTFYDAGKLAAFTADLGSDAVTVALLTDSYTPSASHSTWGDVSANEVADADYSQQALGSASLTQSGGTVTFDGSDISFGASVTITAKYAVFVLGTAGALASGDSLLGYVDLDTSGGSVSSTNSTFAVNTPNNLFTAS